MSPSCSSILPRALSLWQHGLGRPHPPLLPLPPSSPLLDCLSIFIPPVDPYPLLYATDRHTSGTKRSSALSSGCHTGSAALTHSVYHSRGRDTRKHMTFGLCVRVCLCAHVCVCAAVILGGVITRVISSGAPESPMFLLSLPGAYGSSVHWARCSKQIIVSPPAPSPNRGHIRSDWPHISGIELNSLSVSWWLVAGEREV